MVKLRLQRYGTKKRPFYRLVVADIRDRRDGRFVEIVGQYDPLNTKESVRFEKEKIEGWIQKGAIPTETVATLLKKNGISIKAESGKKTHKTKAAS